MTRNDRRLWKLIGLATGVATGIWLWRRGMERAWELAEADPLIPMEGDAAESLARALASDPELAAFDVRVHAVSDGVVEITGEVAEPAQRARVVAMAHNTPGVDTVVNRVVIPDRAPAPEPDPVPEGEPTPESESGSDTEPVS
jgi:hypothetical protein